mmetsp:Transcript_2952/g.3736  ORF Transcript_2952/g.3736 Transcript_2952/m.3736 type:complete len:91 (+) Transcript_2952:153-425(+)
MVELVLDDLDWEHAATLGEALGLIRSGKAAVEATGAGIDEDGVLQIAKLLENNETCRKLNLSANNIGKAIAMSLYFCYLSSGIVFLSELN